MDCSVNCSCARAKHVDHNVDDQDGQQERNGNAQSRGKVHLRQRSQRRPGPNAEAGKQGHFSPQDKVAVGMIGKVQNTP